MKPRFKPRHQYDLESEELAGELAKTYFDDASLTQQQYKDEVDLNVMVRRFGIGDGGIPAGAITPGLVQDFTEYSGLDLTDVFARVRHAEQLFGELSADVRARFNNNPAQLLDFVMNPANADESVKLGLLVAEPTKAPVDPAPETKTP